MRSLRCWAIVTLALVAVLQAPARAQGASPPPPPLHPPSWGHPVPSDPRRPHPARALRAPRPRVPTGRDTAFSRNWSGLVATGTQFTGDAGQWTVPQVQPSGTNSYSATWVGLDGWTNSTVIQTGTEQDSGNGGTNYFAWYELFPSPPVDIGGVSPGDQMQAAVAQASPGNWTISIADLTSHQSFSTPVSYAGPGQSAEWIEEAPSDSSGQVLPLANFGALQFTNTAMSGGNLSSVSLDPVLMQNAVGKIISYPGNINPSAGSLTVTFGSPVFRLAGSTRIGTAVAISQDSFGPGAASAVVLSRDDAFPDALAGGPLATQRGGPLLLTEPTGLDPATQTEIQRVLPTGRTVYLLGGDQALSPSIDPALQGLGYQTQRLSGPTRFATAVAIAQALGNPSTVFEATGLDFPDALSGGPAAATTGAAVVLTDGAAQAPETAAYLGQHPADTRYALGGPAAAADAGATPIVGSDRFDTSALVARRFFPSPSAATVATGLDFPDALAAGPHAASKRAPLLVVEPSAPLPGSVGSYMAGNAPTIAAAWVYGGTAAVGADVQEAVRQAIV